MVKNNEPVRCFEGNARPHEAFWNWKPANQEAGEDPEVELYGYISEYSWFEDDVTPEMFKKDLMKYGGGGPITVRMNSYGGDVIAASLISTMIKDYPGFVTVVVDGIAASAATVVAVAGDQVKMQETAYFMIHDPLAIFMFAALNIEELSRMVDSLKAVKEGIVNAYESKTGLSRSRISNMMTEETWMDAQKAVDLGFVDEVIRTGGGSETIPLPVDKAAIVNALRNYHNVPAALGRVINPPLQDVNVPAGLLAPATAPEEPECAKPAAVETQAAERLRAEAKILGRPTKKE